MRRSGGEGKVCRCAATSRKESDERGPRNCIGPVRWLDFNRSATYKVAENQIIPARPVPRPPPLAASFAFSPPLASSPTLLRRRRLRPSSISAFRLATTANHFLLDQGFFSFSLFFFFFISLIFIDSCKSNGSIQRTSQPASQPEASPQPTLTIRTNEKSPSSADARIVFAVELSALRYAEVCVTVSRLGRRRFRPRMPETKVSTVKKKRSASRREERR